MEEVIDSIVSPEASMPTKHTLFKPTLTETRADETTRVARQLIDDATAKREESRQRLKTARLEREDAEAASVGAVPEKGKPRKAGASRK